MSVKINVKTTIFHENGKEIMETAAYGRFYQKDNASFLQYEEEGEEGKIRTTVKLAGDEGLILRNGAIKMRLPFSLNKQREGSYQLSFGQFAIFSSAQKIDHSYDAKHGKGSINIVYEFSMQGAGNSNTYHLEITFQEEIK
jgi:uncharacterized beta-barrel protein YwiB (DUF1934 family)